MEQLKSQVVEIEKSVQQWNVQYVEIATIVAMIIASVMIMLFISNLIKSEQLRRSYDNLMYKSNKATIERMKKSKIKMFNYDALEAYIKSTGLGYMTNDKLTPTSYVIIKIILSLLGFVIGIQDSLILAIFFMAIGYFGIDIIARLSDAQDNSTMLEDIKAIYDTLRIQTKAGVYITSVITDCYLVVQNKRLKTALLRLTSDIIAKNDIEDALDSFRDKFHNSYIDTLVVIIKQSMQTGQASKMLDDIKSQMIDIEAAMSLAEQIKIRNQITIVQVIVYIGIIGVAIFTAMQSVTGVF